MFGGLAVAGPTTVAHSTEAARSADRYRIVGSCERDLTASPVRGWHVRRELLVQSFPGGLPGAGRVGRPGQVGQLRRVGVVGVQFRAE